MHEIVVNLHMHTRYSDGGGLHRDIARAALRTGLDAVIVTDHNVLVRGLEGYYEEAGRRVLLLIGEEIHDQSRKPQKNHMLVLGSADEMAPAPGDPQLLISRARNAGGLTFLAHPNESAATLFGEPDISWVDWQVRDFTGLEIWNALSELKDVVPTRWHALLHAYIPALVAHGPRPATLNLWDELLAAGRRVAAVGGSDAHASRLHMGPMSRVIFPYDFHFRGVNNHLLLPSPLSGELAADRRLIYEALGHGRGFVGYDLPASTRGFRFSAHGRDQRALMGDEIRAAGTITLQGRLPAAAEIRLLRDGELLKRWASQQAFTFAGRDPGAYRVEAYRPYLGQRRGWIFSNPIYVK